MVSMEIRKSDRYARDCPVGYRMPSQRFLFIGMRVLTAGIAVIVLVPVAKDPGKSTIVAGMRVGEDV